VGFLRECIPGVWWGLGSPLRLLVGEKRKRREKASEIFKASEYCSYSASAIKSYSI